jgi:hypothetical protein
MDRELPIVAQQLEARENARAESVELDEDEPKEPGKRPVRAGN